MERIQLAGRVPTLRDNLRAMRSLHKAQSNSQLLEELRQQTQSVLDARKEQGAKPERTWFPHFKETGTPYVGDCFHF